MLAIEPNMASAARETAAAALMLGSVGSVMRSGLGSLCATRTIESQDEVRSERAFVQERMII